VLTADFFAHSYASLARGATENMNGLIHQLFSEAMCIDSITDESIALKMLRLNRRPRKCLVSRTPYPIFVLQLE
jgi:IS30 family transposase